MLENKHISNYSFNIRAATTSDATDIAYVHFTTWQHTYQYLLSKVLLESFTLKQRSLSREKILLDKSTICLVAEDSNRNIIGFADFGKCRETTLGCGSEVYALYILPDAQRIGAGQELFLTAVSYLRNHFDGKTLVWVLENNINARNFYEKMGGLLFDKKESNRGNDTIIEVAYAC